MKNTLVLRFVPVLVLAFFTIALNAQSVQRTDFVIDHVAEAQPGENADDWRPSVISAEAPFPGSHSYRSYLLQLKEEMKANPVTPSYKKQQSTATADKPVLGRNFDGNPYNNSVPCDNDMAISNDGKLISVVNRNILIVDVENDTILFEQSLNNFTDTALGLSASQYDPKVAYDPKEDRFILVYLNGTMSSNSAIIVAFSATNDPLGTWYQYAIPGNPFMDDTWSDYPIIAMTDDDFYITVNLIRDGMSWQAGFKESLCWQIRKSDGYSGSMLNTTLFNNINFGGEPIRNLCPIQGGETTYGPGIMMLSNRNFSMSNDTIFVMEVTGNQADPTATVTVDFSIADLEYGAAPNGMQPGGSELQTNDARVLGGFMEDGVIHFVGNSNVPDYGRAGIYHGVISNLGTSNDVTGFLIGDSIMDLGYPNISYSGKNDFDMQAIITFNHSSADSFPGTSAMFYDQYDGHSERLSIKQGNSNVSIIGSPERWGDYSGSQRRYNEPGTVWMSGYYGDRRFTGGILRNVSVTWIAELTSPKTTGVGIAEAEEEASGVLYPNPVDHTLYFDFTNPTKQILTISIYDMKGQLVTVLLEDGVKSGENRLAFSTEPLSSGTYIVSIENESQRIFSDKFTVAR